MRYFEFKFSLCTNDVTIRIYVFMNCQLTIVSLPSYIHKILNNAHVLVQNNMAANVLILPGMTPLGVYN